MITIPTAESIIDISMPIENDIVSDPAAFRPRVRYFGHDDTREQMLAFFPGMTASDLPDGEAWAIEHVELITHNGTHLDAPYHFHSTMDGASGRSRSTRFRSTGAANQASSSISGISPMAMW
jgi:kynurenine formamidase